jgi:hypothetical protein
MKLLRLIFMVIVFFIGAAVGSHWSVYHPIEATIIAQREHLDSLKVQVAADQAKVDFLTKYGDKIPNGKLLLNDEQAKLDGANAELASLTASTTQPSP